MTTLRPFWTYYGGKWRLAPRYPAPRFATVVEPFAGGAGYALRHYRRRVRLFDVDPVIAGLWRWLIAVKPAELLALPDVVESVEDVQAPQEARWLIGFWLNRGLAEPALKACAWMRSGEWPTQFWGRQVKERLAAQVELIRHWQVEEGSFEGAAQVGEATYFVDPPYQGRAGRSYRHNAVDYAALGAWCRERQGQVICCEQNGATWLPFRPFMRARRTTRGRDEADVSDEVIWTNETAPQMELGL